MEHSDHVALLRDGIAGGGLVWADLGSGGGAFTFALADLLGVHAIAQERIQRDRQQARGVAPLFEEVACAVGQRVQRVHQIGAEPSEGRDVVGADEHID